MMHTNGCTVLATRIPEFPDGVVGLICNALDLTVCVCVCVCVCARRMAVRPGCEKRHLFLSFPYVCPEPVLAK